MSKDTIAEKSLQIRLETEPGMNTNKRVADVLDDINETMIGAPQGSGFYFLNTGGMEPAWTPINPSSYYLNYWDGSSFRATNIYYNSNTQRLGVGTGNVPLTYDFEINGSAKANTLTVTNLPNGETDPTFNQSLVRDNQGRIGWIQKDPVAQILGSLNMTSVPSNIEGVYGTVFKKKDVFLIHIRDAYIAVGAARNAYQYIGDISTAYGINVPFEVMFPVMITTYNGAQNNYYSTIGILYHTQVVIILPTQALNTSLRVTITAYFQFTNTNTSP